MKISNIKIENFKGVEKLTLTDLSDLNIITGINGSGKTSILSAIQILMSWFIARMRHSKGQGQKIQDKDITINKPYCLLEIGFDNGVSWRLYKQRSSFRGHSYGRTDLVELNNLAKSIVENSDKGSDITLIDAYGVNRVVKETPMRVSKTHRLKPSDALSLDMFNKSNIVNFHEFFLWYSEMEDKENEKMHETVHGHLVPEKCLEVVRQAITEVSDGYSDFKVQRRPKAFVIKKNGVKIDFNQLSDGEKSYMSLILDIACKLSITHPSLDNPLEGDGIILIDEIDLHLHPSWQLNVIGDLQRIFPNCQFFITTQSPRVVSCVKVNAADRLIVISEGNALDISANYYGKKSDDILTEIFKVKTLRNPVVQSHIDKVWDCLRVKDISSTTFFKEIGWLHENLEPDDSFFLEVSLQKSLNPERYVMKLINNTITNHYDPERLFCK